MRSRRSDSGRSRSYSRALTRANQRAGNGRPSARTRATRQITARPAPGSSSTSSRKAEPHQSQLFAQQARRAPTARERIGLARDHAAPSVRRPRPAIDLHARARRCLRGGRRVAQAHRRETQPRPRSTSTLPWLTAAGRLRSCSARTVGGSVSNCAASSCRYSGSRHGRAHRPGSIQISEAMRPVRWSRRCEKKRCGSEIVHRPPPWMRPASMPSACEPAARQRIQVDAPVVRARGDERCAARPVARDERVVDLFADLVLLRSRGRPQPRHASGPAAVRIAATVASSTPAGKPAPAGVRRADFAAVVGAEQHRHAVGGEDRQHGARRRRSPRRRPRARPTVAAPVDRDASHLRPSCHAPAAASAARDGSAACSTSSSRLRSTASGSSPARRPRLKLSNGGCDTPSAVAQRGERRARSPAPASCGRKRRPRRIASALAGSAAARCRRAAPAPARACRPAPARCSAPARR